MRRLLLPLVIAFACAAAPASALAATRYASPSGSGTACTSAHPCSITQAFNSQPEGLVIELAAETYATPDSNLFLGAGEELRGPAGPAKAILNGNTGGLEVQGGGAVVRNVTITTVSGGPLTLLDGSSAYDVVSQAGSGFSGASSCEAAGNVTLVDSVCASAATNGIGLEFDPSSGGNIPLFLRGVTAVATGGGTSAGLQVEPGSSVTAVVNSHNSIFHGVGKDIVLNPGSGNVQLSTSHSNFSATSPGTATLTTDGTDQTAAPAFVDAAAGDYHEAAGSPTIDAGDNRYAGGATDPDGNPRILGTAIDIGAYEFVPPPPAVTTGAATNITTGGATLNGSVNPNTNPTQDWFQIGQTTAYGLTTAAQSAPGGAVSQAAGSLAPGTTYHYRLVAQSATGTTFGADQTFTTATPLLPPLGPPSPRLGGVAQATANAVVVGLSCLIGGCRFTETLTVVERLDPGHAVVGVGARRRARTRKVVVGSQTLTLLPGDTTTSIVKLNAAGRRLLERFHRLPVKLTVAVAGARPLTATLTIRRSR